MDTWSNYLCMFVVIVPLSSPFTFSNYAQRSIYNKLMQEEEFEGFGGLIRNNKDAKMDLLQQELTAFIPVIGCYVLRRGWAGIGDWMCAGDGGGWGLGMWVNMDAGKREITGFDEFVNYMYAYKFDIVALSETWLSAGDKSSSFLIPGYKFIRTDREGRGGRVAFYVRKYIHFKKTNEAFRNYKKPLHSDLAFYHMAEGVRTLEDLKSVHNMSNLKANFPKLWITRTGQKIFINNAEIITSSSNYPGRTGNGKNGKEQMLHIIDEVLDPVIRGPRYPHTAYDFMASGYKWHLDANKSVTSFFHKVKEEYDLSHLYQLQGANTYFIPIDRGIDFHKFKMLNKDAIFGHIIPNFVLFTRPTMRGYTYETMANDDSIYIVLSLEECDNKTYVKGDTVTGNSNNPIGSFMAEIIEANIPVYNGIVHLISQPLGIFNRTLHPFPYLHVLEKLATDPALDTVYEMGEKTGFNKIFTTHNAFFTYFVPNEYAWKQIKKNRLSFSGSEVDLLKRHLIISDTPYSMERLLAMATSRNKSDVELTTVGGILKLNVLIIDNDFYIRWSDRYIKVLRPNYECPDGLIHVLAAPIANLY